MDWAIIAAILYVGAWVLFAVALFIVPRNRKPGEATAWLMLIFLLPFLGFLLYLVLGSPKLSKQRRAMQGSMSETLTKMIDTLKQHPDWAHVAAELDPPIPERYQPIVCLNQRLGTMPAIGGNSVELLPDYQGAIDRIIEEIDRAQKYVHVEYFMFADDSTGGPVIDALIRAQERGVKCRVLIDDLGDFQFKKPVVTRLRAGNVETHLMLPVIIVGKGWTRPDLRNHRKIVVVDGQVGFTGSQNIIDRNYHKGANIKKGLYYIELVARVTGPVVAQLDAAFRTDWYSETNVVLTRENAPEVALAPVKTGDVVCQVLPSGPGFENDNNLKLFVALFHAARHKITIANPYFVPDESLMVAITSAAQRGVEVTLIVSEIGDQFLVFHAQRSFYEQLLEAGVKIHRYKSPVLLHSKHLSIDDDIAVIGSSNMDMRSFQLDLEVTLICYDKGVVTDMQAVFADYLSHSAPLRLNEWETRPTRTKFFDNLARLTSSLQ
jgi:cardiolipin synthase